MTEIFKIEYLKTKREFREYSTNIILANIGLSIFFVGILQNLQVSTSHQTTIMLMLMWYSGIHGFNNPAYTIEEEVADGTMTSVVNSTIGIYKLLMIRSLFTALADFVKSVAMFALIVVVIGRTVQILNINMLHPIFLLTYAMVIFTAYNIGMLIAGLALKYRSITSVSGVVYYAVFFFSGFIVPIESRVGMIVADLLPFRRANILTESLLNDNIIEWGSFFFIMFLSLAWWGVSFVWFNKMLNVAKRDGLIAYE